MRPLERLPWLTVPATAQLGLAVRDGVVDVAIEEAGIGPLPVPQAAQGPLAVLAAQAVDAAVALGDVGVEVTGVRSADGRLVVEARSAEPLPVTRERIRALQGAQPATARPAGHAPERPPLPPGRMASGDAGAGAPWVLGLGDSVAAGLGAGDPREGLLARVHAAWEEHTGERHGMRLLARVGERSDMLRWGGQLAQAEAFLAAQPVDLVVLSLGANDVLTELTAPPCRRGWCC